MVEHLAKKVRYILRDSVYARISLEIRFLPKFSNRQEITIPALVKGRLFNYIVNSIASFCHGKSDTDEEEKK